MKTIILIAPIFITHAATAQIKNFHTFPKLGDMLKTPSGLSKRYGSWNNQNGIIINPTNLKVKIVSLPLDNMPCLVPDTRSFNMPVAFGMLSLNMPNGIVVQLR